MGIRTPDLLIANETLYQLSYTPAVLAQRMRPSRKEYGKRNPSGKRKHSNAYKSTGPWGPIRTFPAYRRAATK